MTKEYNQIITVINKELDAEHKHAMNKIRKMIVKKEQHESQLKQRLHELKERFKRLEGLLPQLNDEIKKLEDLNKRSLKVKKSNERKQVITKKKIEELQNELKALINTHSQLIEEMNERNKKENELIHRTDRILFFKKQLLKLMRKTKTEIGRTEKQLLLLGKEEGELEKTKLPEIDSAAMLKPKKKSRKKSTKVKMSKKKKQEHPHVKISKRKGKAHIYRKKEDKDKVEVHKKTIKFDPEDGVKVHIKVKKD